jgi:drug/metabolite transporter (DMT)-like permease
MVSGLVSIVFALSVGCNIINGALFLGRRVKPSVVVAALVGVLGLVLVFWEEIINAGGSTAIALGVLLGVAGTLSFSFGNIASSKSQQFGLPIVPATAWSMLYGGLFTTIGCLVTGQKFTLELSVPYLAGLVYLAVFGSAIAFVAYLTLLGQIGPDRAAFATVMFPLVSLTLSTVFEGYRWTVPALLGVVLVLAANATMLVGPQLRIAARRLITSRTGGVT